MVLVPARAVLVCEWSVIGLYGSITFKAMSMLDPMLDLNWKMCNSMVRAKGHKHGVHELPLSLNKYVLYHI